MAEQVDNLVLEHLRVIRADVAAMRSDLKENTTRLGRVEVSLAGMRRDLAHEEEAAAEQGLRIDALKDRIERIERRLEING